MEHILKLTAAGAGLLAIWYFLSRMKDSRVARPVGFASPPKYHHKDLFLGLDYILGTHFDMPSISRHHSLYGNTFQTNIMGGVQLNTCSSLNARAIVGNNRDWGVEPLRLPGMDLFCGKGIITSDGAAWEHSKGLLKYMFRTSNIVNLPAVDVAVKDFLTHIPSDGATVDLQPLFSHLFLHTATHFLLGFNSLSAGEDGDNIYGNVETFTRDFHDSMFLCGMRIVLGRLRFLIPRRKVEKAFRSSHQFLEYYIDRALAKKEDHDIYEESKSPSLIEGLVHQTDDRSEIRNQALQTLMAASDTISILLSNTIFLLARHPEVWKKLREEILSASPETPTIESLNAPGLLRNVLFEALRLYPVFPILGRVALVDTTLPEGGGTAGNSPIFVQAGTRADISFYTMFRNESVFGPDADKFVPRRWETIKPDQWAFLPFGRGPRSCMGREKALLEASYVLTVMARTFERIDSRDDRDHKAEMKLTCANGNGCKVALLK